LIILGFFEPKRKDFLKNNQNFGYFVQNKVKLFKNYLQSFKIRECCSKIKKIRSKLGTSVLNLNLVVPNLIISVQNPRQLKLNFPHLLLRLIANVNHENQKQIVVNAESQSIAIFRHQIAKHRQILVHRETHKYREEKDQSVAEHELKHEADIDQVTQVNALAVNVIENANHFDLIVFVERWRSHFQF
jgi:hypothetical protein